MDALSVYGHVLLLAMVALSLTPSLSHNSTQSRAYSSSQVTDQTYDYVSYIREQLPLVANSRDLSNVSRLIEIGRAHNVVQLSLTYTRSSGNSTLTVRMVSAR